MQTYENFVSDQSEGADLVIMGFSVEKLTQEQGAFFKKFENIKDILFVRAGQKIAISEGSTQCQTWDFWSYSGNSIPGFIGYARDSLVSSASGLKSHASVRFFLFSV